MNTKILLLLATLMCTMPSVSFGSRLGGAFFDYGNVTKEQEARVRKTPASPDHDPVAVSWNWDEGTFTTILEQNPNIELQAVAAFMLGKMYAKDIFKTLVDSGFCGIPDKTQATRKHYKKAYDLLAKLKQTAEIKDIRRGLENCVMEFRGLGAQSVQDCQELIDQVTDLGFEVAQTAKEIYEEYYADRS